MQTDISVHQVVVPKWLRGRKMTQLKFCMRVHSEPCMFLCVSRNYIHIHAGMNPSKSMFCWTSYQYNSVMATVYKIRIRITLDKNRTEHRSTHTSHKFTFGQTPDQTATRVRHDSLNRQLVLIPFIHYAY